MNDQRTVLDVLPFCWLSGMRHRPKDWYARWHLHVAHIASGGGRARRARDRRAVIGLSPLCHKLHVSNSEAHPTMVINGVTYPTIDERHTLYLKRAHDPVFFDVDFLQTIWIGRVPEPERPPDYWCMQMLENQGIVL